MEKPKSDFQRIGIWIERHRFTAGSIIFTLLAVAYYQIYGVLRDEWLRLTWWQRTTMWLADGMCLYVLIAWMRSPSFLDRDGSCKAPQLLHNSARRIRWLVATLLVSVVCDIAVTGSFVYSDKVSSDRTVAVDATVVQRIGPPGPATGKFELTVEFVDANGQLHSEALIVRLLRRNHARLRGVDKATDDRIHQAPIPFAIPIRYDPEIPGRVWLKDDDWSLWAAPGMSFLIFHCVQFIIVSVLAIRILLPRNLKRATALSIQLLPILSIATFVIAMMISTSFVIPLKGLG